MTCDKCKHKQLRLLDSKATGKYRLRVFCGHEKCFVAPGFEKKCLYFMLKDERFKGRP
jgi:hypothetical protein